MFILILLSMVLVLCFILYLFPHIEILGDSMSPTYSPGEKVWGVRLLFKGLLFKLHLLHLKEGDIYTFKLPFEDRYLIKRVVGICDIDNELLLVEGDNSDNSYDSRVFGYISYKCLVAKVFNPRERSTKRNA